MVGVPGRSKACHNCRQRRIKCTGERPGCQNCAKTNRLCAGYIRNHAIVLAKEMFNGQDLSTSVLAPDRGHGEVAAVSVHIGRWRVDQSKFKHPVVSLPMSRAALIQTEYLPICMEMDPRRAYREQFFSLFVTDASPTTYSPEIAAVGNNWMLDILRLSTLSPALENGALAVCAARFGKQNRIPGLVRQSLALYTQGLRSFSLEICDESSVQNEQLLAAGMVMLMYEVSECPGGTADAYQQHYKGTMRLLELRGPEAHRSGLGHCVFQSLRVHQMYQAFVRGSVAVLSEPKWRDIPFAQPKDYSDQLLDILLDTTSFRPRRRYIDNVTDPERILLETLASIREGLQIEELLTQWHTRFKETVAGPLYYPELPKRKYEIDDSDLGKVFPVAFRFHDFDIAQNLVFYWMALLCVHAHLGWLYGTLARLTGALDLIRADLPCTCDSDCLKHFTMDELPVLGDRLDWPRTTAYNICQSVDYCLQNHGRGFRPVSVLPVLSVVKGHWIHWPGDWSREIAWIDENLSMLGQERSIIAQHLI